MSSTRTTIPSTIEVSDEWLVEGRAPLGLLASMSLGAAAAAGHIDLRETQQISLALDHPLGGGPHALRVRGSCTHSWVRLGPARAHIATVEFCGPARRCCPPLGPDDALRVDGPDPEAVIERRPLPADDTELTAACWVRRHHPTRPGPWGALTALDHRPFPPTGGALPGVDRLRSAQLMVFPAATDVGPDSWMLHRAAVEHIGADIVEIGTVDDEAGTPLVSYQYRHTFACTRAPVVPR